jgi:hypothetical protein
MLRRSILKSANQKAASMTHYALVTSLFLKGRTVRKSVNVGYRKLRIGVMIG